MTNTTNKLCRVWHDGVNARYRSEWCDVPTNIVRKAASLRKLTMADNAPLALTWIERVDYSGGSWWVVHVMVGQVKIGIATYDRPDNETGKPVFHLANQGGFGFREVSESHWTKTIRTQLKTV